MEKEREGGLGWRWCNKRDENKSPPVQCLAFCEIGSCKQTAKKHLHWKEEDVTTLGDEGEPGKMAKESETRRLCTGIAALFQI